MKDTSTDDGSLYRDEQTERVDRDTVFAVATLMSIFGAAGVVAVYSARFFDGPIARVIGAGFVWIALVGLAFGVLALVSDWLDSREST